LLKSHLVTGHTKVVKISLPSKPNMLQEYNGIHFLSNTPPNTLQTLAHDRPPFKLPIDLSVPPIFDGTKRDNASFITFDGDDG
jgi:hypothetical protein